MEKQEILPVERKTSTIPSARLLQEEQQFPGTNQILQEVAEFQ